MKEQNVMHDDDEPGTQSLVRERHVHITGFHCNADSLSFYDESGSIQGKRLESLLPPSHDPIIGWFSSRKGLGGLLQPTMLETSVSHSLAEYMGQQGGSLQAPPLLAVLSKQVHHNGATTTRLYRFYEAEFQCSRGQPLAPPPLLPRELQITNLARTPQRIHKAYTSFEPVMASKKANSPEAAAALAKLSSSVDQQVQQVDTVQEYTQSLLRDLSRACKVASGHSATLSSLRAEGEALQQQLADV